MNRSYLHSLSKSLHPQSFVADGCPGGQVGLKLFLKLGNRTSTLFLDLDHLHSLKDQLQSFSDLYPKMKPLYRNRNGLSWDYEAPPIRHKGLTEEFKY